MGTTFGMARRSSSGAPSRVTWGVGGPPGPDLVRSGAGTALLAREVFHDQIERPPTLYLGEGFDRFAHEHAAGLARNRDVGETRVADVVEGAHYGPIYAARKRTGKVGMLPLRAPATNFTRDAPRPTGGVFRLNGKFSKKSLPPPGPNTEGRAPHFDGAARDTPRAARHADFAAAKPRTTSLKVARTRRGSARCGKSKGLTPRRDKVVDNRN